MFSASLLFCCSLGFGKGYKHHAMFYNDEPPFKRYVYIGTAVLNNNTPNKTVDWDQHGRLLTARYPIAGSPETAKAEVCVFRPKSSVAVIWCHLLILAYFS